MSWLTIIGYLAGTVILGTALIFAVTLALAYFGKPDADVSGWDDE